MKEDTKSVLDFALDYAIKKKWSLFPLHSVRAGACTCGKRDCRHAGKHPLIHNGLNGATSNIDAIKQYWTRRLYANIAIRTGKASGFFTLDIDDRHGGDQSLREQERKNGFLPPTVRSITGGGGQHVLFRLPGEGTVPSRVNLFPGIDIRGEGGYIVAPPSLHASGRKYCWDLEGHPDDIGIAEAPEWLLNAINAHNMPKRKTSDEWASIIAAAKCPGSRNDAMTRIIGYLIRHGIDIHVTASMALAFNRTYVQPPQDERDVMATISSIAKKHFGRFQSRKEENHG